MRRIVIACTLIALATGCASTAARMPGTRVDEKIRDELPLEGRRWAYEAENEIIIALDRRDDAAERLADARAKVEEAEAAEDTASRSGKAKEPAKALVAWREAQRRHAEAKVDEAEVAVYCARTSFELTKARLAVRFGFPVKEGFVKGFESQHESCAKEMADAAAATRDAEVKAAKALEGWRESRREYVNRTGDHDHGLWID